MRITVLALMAVFMVSCAKGPFGNVTDEEYSVYSAMLSGAGAGGLTGSIVIKEMTADREKMDEDRIIYFQENSPPVSGGYSGIELDRSMVEDYNRKNGRQWGLQDKFDLPASIVLMTEEELDNIFSEGEGWKGFYLRYPSSPGITEFSRVGFNKDMTRAFFYYGNQSNWLAGAGYYMYMAKRDGKWELVGQVMAWIS